MFGQAFNVLSLLHTPESVNKHVRRARLRLGASVPVHADALRQAPDVGQGEAQGDDPGAAAAHLQRTAETAWN